MPRYRLLIEYDGRGFVGWQRQDNGLGVQEVLEAAAAALAGGTPVEAVAAGRTDAGVHAAGQVVHVDLDRQLVGDKLRDALNFHMKGHPVAVLEAGPVDPGFHARFSASGRVYQYRIVNRRPPLVLEAGRAWWVPVPLDAAAMDRAADVLLGRHDFTTFRATQCQARSPEKTLDRLEVRRLGEDIRIVAEARSFLHHQVRNMVGSLKLVGEGKWDLHDLRRALEARDRDAGGPTAPAEGLYLMRVDYTD